MHADLHSEVKHLSLNRFRVTMDTAHATSEVFIQNKIQKKKYIKKTQAHKKTVYSQGNLFVLATNL